jgi:hypothetical protein
MTPSIAPDLTPAPRSASPSWISFTVTALANSKIRLGVSGGWPRMMEDVSPEEMQKRVEAMFAAKK